MTLLQIIWTQGNKGILQKISLHLEETDHFLRNTVCQKSANRRGNASPTSVKEIELIIYTLLQKKSPGFYD